MNFPLNRSTDADEYERFRREDRRAYLVSVAVVIVMACGFVVSVYAATHFFN